MISEQDGDQDRALDENPSDGLRTESDRENFLTGSLMSDMLLPGNVSGIQPSRVWQSTFSSDLEGGIFPCSITEGGWSKGGSTVGIYSGCLGLSDVLEDKSDLGL